MHLHIVCMHLYMYNPKVVLGVLACIIHVHPKGVHFFIASVHCYMPAQRCTFLHAFMYCLYEACAACIYVLPVWRLCSYARRSEGVLVLRYFDAVL